MLIRVCDICNELIGKNKYIIKHIKEEVIPTYGGVVCPSTKTKIEICENCFNKFKEFVKNES